MVVSSLLGLTLYISSSLFGHAKTWKCSSPLNIDVEASMIQAALFIYATCEKWGLTYKIKIKKVYNKLDVHC